MNMEEVPAEEALKRRCIADTSLLNNFVHSGSSHLLNQLLEGPVLLSPAVMDPQEIILPGFPREPPSSELLKTLHLASVYGQERYRKIAPFVQSFALDSGELWEPVEPTEEELILANHFRSKEIKEEVRERCPEIRRSRIRLGTGEAETAAIAVTRELTFLTDDQGSVDLIGCLFPHVPVLRTCLLLKYAVEQRYTLCKDAAELVNYRIVDNLGFRARRKSRSGHERLYLRCEPPRCSWEEAT